MCQVDPHLLDEIDLKETLTFLMIYQERGVSKAARKLGLGQPAVSNTLAKLRSKYDDLLFTRSKCEPTPKSHKLAALMLPLVVSLQNAVPHLNAIKESDFC